MRSRRCASTCSWCATGSRSSSVTPSARAISNTSSACGSSHSPPNRPCGARRASTTPLPSPIHSAARASSGSSWARLRGVATGSSSPRVAQWRASGQARQRGAVGAHNVAPSSIRPWLRSPGAARAGRAAISSPARAHSARWPAADLMSSPIANTRANTRATLPSTSGARSPNAIDAIAPAVYGPIPGTSRSSLARAGNAPPMRSTTARAPDHRFRARV
jgi:hypothetical protein